MRKVLIIIILLVSCRENIELNQLDNLTFVASVSENSLNKSYFTQYHIIIIDAYGNEKYNVLNSTTGGEIETDCILYKNDMVIMTCTSLNDEVISTLICYDYKNNILGKIESIMSKSNTIEIIL